MGLIKIRDTHGQRSSSMTFAMRWKHGNLRLIILSAAISIAMTFMFLVLLYGTAVKSVTVAINGQETVVETKQWVLERLLDEQAIAIGPHDEVSVPLHAPIKDGDRIEIIHAIPVTVKADGKLSTVYTTGRTVKDALDELDLDIGNQDKVIPSLGGTVEAEDTVTVVRVETKVASFERLIPFSVVKQNDPTLEQGKEKVVQQGVEGVAVEQVQERYEDGSLVANHSIGEVVQTAAVDQVIAIGTKKPEPKVTVLSKNSPDVTTVTKGDTTFNAKKVLNNVTLTAYNAGFASTGKTEDHPQYGITASGARVQEGRTIAVDPKVIPMGWWVYIEGVGFRRAEDKGGAIKGNKIDVYFDSSSHVKKFGRKKGVTVYIIGPNKPSSI